MLASHWSAGALYAALAAPLFLAALVLYWAERRQTAPTSSTLSYERLDASK
jgi:hypothetical protein